MVRVGFAPALVPPAIASSVGRPPFDFLEKMPNIVSVLLLVLKRAVPSPGASRKWAIQGRHDSYINKVGNFALYSSSFVEFYFILR
ncbi:hypothetical protein [Microbulbifer hainanensis]|uniref:hypothetical protein n=1 Tax=Microbulbifer hainanensis TaxID=2735675 RepID=UPI0018682B5B|nr:hypothetical protein [Microbulbifer hainanensis]